MASVCSIYNSLRWAFTKNALEWKIRGILSFGTLGLLPLIEIISETVKEKGNMFTYYPKQRTNINSIKRTNKKWMPKKSGCLKNRWNYIFSATLFSKYNLNLIELCSFLLKENVCPPSPQKDNYELLSAEN